MTMGELYLLIDPTVKATEATLDAVLEVQLPALREQVMTETKNKAKQRRQLAEIAETQSAVIDRKLAVDKFRKRLKGLTRMIALACHDDSVPMPTDDETEITDGPTVKFKAG